MVSMATWADRPPLHCHDQWPAFCLGSRQTERASHPVLASRSWVELLQMPRSLRGTGPRWCLFVLIQFWELVSVLIRIRFSYAFFTGSIIKIVEPWPLTVPFFRTRFGSGSKEMTRFRNPCTAPGLPSSIQIYSLLLDWQSRGPGYWYFW